MAALLVSNTQAAARSLTRREADPALAPEATPLAAWWGIEDLWLRLRAQLPMIVRREPDGEALVSLGFRRRSAGELRSAALNQRCYAWETDGAHGSFVQRLCYQGDDLVFLPSALSVIRRLPEGEEVAERTWTPPFAKLSVHGGVKGKIAPVHSDFCAGDAHCP